MTNMHEVELSAESVADGSERLQWWFWPLLLMCILVSPLALVLLLLAEVISIPARIILRDQQYRRERKLQALLASVGRFIPWPEVETQLKNGSGTLIVQLRSPNRTMRTWWTADDIIGKAPLLLPRSFSEIYFEADLKPLHVYTRHCLERYLAEDYGSGKLTEAPLPRSAPNDLHGLTYVMQNDELVVQITLPRGRNLRQQFPQAKVVTVFEWIRDPVMAIGDAEAVFAIGAHSSGNSNSSEEPLVIS